MPKPPRLCSCGAIVPHGALCACQVQRQLERKRRYDATRPNSRQRGYTREWEKARRQYLHDHPYCVMCGAFADVVDHKTPHRGNQLLFWNWNNWQALCTPCHSSIKQRQERQTHE